MTLRTEAWQTPLSVGFSRQEHGEGCHFLHQGILLTQGSSSSLASQAGSSPLHHLEARVKRQQGPSHASINCETEMTHPQGTCKHPPLLSNPAEPHSSQQMALVSWFRKNKTTRNGLLPFLSRPDSLEGLPSAHHLSSASSSPAQSSPGLASLPSPHQLLTRHSPGAEFYSQSLVFI